MNSCAPANWAAGDDPLHRHAGISEGDVIAHRAIEEHVFLKDNAICRRSHEGSTMAM